jgi:serine protease Do
MQRKLIHPREISMPRNVRNRAFAIGFLVLAACGGDRGAAFAQHGKDAAPATAQQPLANTATPAQHSQAESLSAVFRSAASRALPAVVFIEVEKKASAADQQQIPEPFRRFFNIPPGGGDGGDAPPVGGAGSGFIIDREGHVVTNNHVVSDAEEVLVRLEDGHEYKATVVGSDDQTDVAVVKINPRPGETLPVSQLGSSQGMQVGDWVLALGSPLELQFTVTAGIISAQGRQLTGNPSNLEAFIQTDAAINPGNSGGPLVNLDGQVIGMNTAIFGGDRFVGYGFAIPVDIVKKSVNDILQYGHVRRPQLGISIQSVSEADAEVYKLPSIAGAEVMTVSDDSPAAKAGIQPEDVIVAVDGQAIKNGTDLTTLLAQHQPGEKVNLTVYRSGQKREFTVPLGEFDRAGATTKKPEERKVAEEALGFRVEPLTPAIARELGIDRTSGVVITEVSPFGGAAEAGLSRGAVVLEINGQAVNTMADVDRIAGALQPGRAVKLKVLTSQNGTTILNYYPRR